ncbi:TetR/AcrR family transcriptional regulator [Desulfosporosinus sp. OT]|uniref:TetR/AcrR family transcriptional regulator n=1 Tax=Desulfosporosinus sp. OT TaxID=913865 RepID=UPI000223B2F3|nr:TetR/AcrR family transcriptional regulator [Desulfosporosinus sp. OT]EGW36064.1 bacterial regulatory s, tetR family protein [Desulfosporosinus sp. OT]
MIDNITSRTERKKKETKQKIVSVAMGLYRAQGIKATTMEQIAEEVDISRKTLYNYFPNKEAIAAEYMKKYVQVHFQDLLQLLNDLPDTCSRLVAVTSTGEEWSRIDVPEDVIVAYREYRLQTFIQSFKDQSLRSGLSDVYRYIIKLGQKSGELRSDIDEKELANYLKMIVTVSFLSNPENYESQEIITKNIDYFLNGARNMSKS